MIATLVFKQNNNTSGMMGVWAENETERGTGTTCVLVGWIWEAEIAHSPPFKQESCPTKSAHNTRIRSKLDSKFKWVKQNIGAKCQERRTLLTCPVQLNVQASAYDPYGGNNWHRANHYLNRW